MLVPNALRLGVFLRGLRGHLLPRSLRGRVLLVFGLALLGTSAVLSTLLFLEMRSTLLGELAKRGEAKAQTLSVHAWRAIESGDLAALDARLSTLLDDADVRFAIARDGEGQVVGQAAREGVELRWARAQIAVGNWSGQGPARLELNSLTGATFIFSAPVSRDDGTPMGTVHVGLSAESTLAQIRRILVVSAAIGALLTLCGIATIFFLTRWMLRPLSRMALVTKAVARGDLSQRADDSTGDEVAHLGQAFNEMTASLAQSGRQLQRRERQLRRIARERARLLESVRLRAARLEVLNDLSKAMASTLEAEQIHRRLHEQLRRLFDYGYLCIVRTGSVPGEFRRAFVWVDEPNETLYLRELELDESALLYGVVAERSDVALSVAAPHASLVESSHGEEGVHATGVFEHESQHGVLPRRLFEAGFRALHVYPLVSSDEAMGALCIAFRSKPEIDAEASGMLRSLADNLALVLRNADLYEQIGRSFRELQETQDRLARAEEARRVDRLRTVGQMASGIAHNFNNVMSAIIGRVQLLKIRLERGEVPAGELAKSLNVIEQAGLDGAETVRRIQEFSRGGIEERSTRASLNDLVRGVIEITRPRWKDEPESRGLHIRIATEFEDLPAVACVPSEIREALTNLIFNAVDAMPEGGTITIRSRRDGPNALLFVEDTGSGMSPEVKERLFDPFFSTKGVKGTGLGLSTVYGILKRHGGAISVESALGRGSRFTIVLPFARSQDGTHSREDTMMSRPWRILVVDDESNVRDVVVELLQLLGHDVVPAVNGTEGLELFRAQEFDLVLTDLGMPDKSGWEVAGEIRKMNEVVPIVLATGWGTQIGEKEARQRGVSRVLAKPFTVQKVSSLIAELQGSQMAA